MSVIPLPLAIFDDLRYISNDIPISCKNNGDYLHALAFIKSYSGSVGTFNSYRREIEKILQWTWLVACKTLPELKRQDIEDFIYFIQEPPKSWIGLKKVPRFIVKDGLRQPNPVWRPFVAKITKAAHKQGHNVTKNDFELASGSVKESFAILSSFFNYLVQEEYLTMNPVALVRQKNKFIRQQHSLQVRRLSEIQWQYVIKTVTMMAEHNPEIHERSLFIISALYLMYLRISELAADERWLPTMNHFYRDQDLNWWFTTVGKGNKQRQIAVSDTMLAALSRWRTHLNLSPLPSPADQTPLLPKIKGKGFITSTTYLREIVQHCFDQAIEQLYQANLPIEAENLMTATVHWLRHTGISDDVKHRPREHVRDDAGHSSSAITDRYIDIELKARHKSAKHKKIVHD